MKVKILNDYMNLCKNLGIEPTVQGLKNYKWHYY